MIDDEAGLIIWAGELKSPGHRHMDLSQRSTQTYTVIWDQYSPTMRGKLEQLANNDAINTTKNPVTLLEEIHNVICGREAHN